MTQYTAAREGLLTEEIRSAAVSESVPPGLVMAEIAAGRAVLPANPGHSGLRAVVAGTAFRTKVNANIGVSAGHSSPGEELAKLRTALDAGADFVMDLSVGAGLADIRRGLLAASERPLGTVPVYEAISRAGGAEGLEPQLLLDVIREQAEQGVDFMTLHAGLLRAHVPLAVRRLMGIVSRGGALLAEWMVRRGEENPLYANWDRVLDICAQHDVTVSLGDGLRPGCLADAGDEAQFAELDALGELVRRCRARGVQVMVEGPGHVPLHLVAEQMERERRVCDGAPFYVLGPLVTDIAAGYDHIACAIGAACAAMHGAALICYVTPAEHLGLPGPGDVRDGVMACRVAAHAGDVAKGLPGARERDDAMSRARADLDWERQFELALDGECARARHRTAAAHAGAMADDFCSMCGREFCAVRATRRIRESL